MGKFGRISGIRPAGILPFLAINGMRRIFFSPIFALVGGEFTLGASCESIPVSLAEVTKRFVLRWDEIRFF